MAPTKLANAVKQRAPSLSLELGEGDLAPTENARTGRPIRSLRARKTDSPFVDSAVAISEAEESDRTDSVEDDVIVVKSKKRKHALSPSPSLSPELSPLSSPGLDDLPLSKTEDEVLSDSNAQPLKVTLNVPAGPDRQITLNLDIGSLFKASRKDGPHADSGVLTRPKKIAKSTNTGAARQERSRLAPRDSSSTMDSAGFLDLPAELRNEIYRMIFVAPGRIDFGQPNSKFKRGSALLRTCHQVHIEGRGILYSENEFFFQRRSMRHGSYWDNEWSELGYKTVRKFLKGIGHTNTGLIRHVTMLFEDAVPSLNPHLHTAEERRFVHDKVLQSALSHLSRHGRLEKFHLHLAGRREVNSRWSNEQFLDLLQDITADEVEFVKHPVWGQQWHGDYARSKQSEDVKKTCLKLMVRSKKLYGLKQ